MKARRNFMELLMAGSVTFAEIDDFVGEWHRGGSGLDLHEYLGLSLSEYSYWVTNPNSLKNILRKRKLTRV